MIASSCHADRKNYAQGLCQACYQRTYRPKWTTKRKADCHPDRPHRSRGLCATCYDKVRNAKTFVSVGRVARANECGHPDRPHVGHGLCQSCYTKHRRSIGGQIGKRARKDGELRRRYGISIHDFAGMLAIQGNVCAICQDGFASERDKHVDHCHESGAVRGILCYACNKALGALGDNEPGLLRALAYVRGELLFDKEPAHA